jgi:hypothetical protein
VFSQGLLNFEFKEKAADALEGAQLDLIEQGAGLVELSQRHEQAHIRLKNQLIIRVRQHRLLIEPSRMMQMPPAAQAAGVLAL